MEIRSEGKYDVAILVCPEGVVSDVLHQGLDEANKRRDILPEPLVVMPDGDIRNRFLVYCPHGYNLEPFEAKVMRRMYEIAQTTD